MRRRKAVLLSGRQPKRVALERAPGIGIRRLLPHEPLEGISSALPERISDILASLNGKGLTVLMPQSDLNYLITLFDAEFVIERAANLSN